MPALEQIKNNAGLISKKKKKKKIKNKRNRINFKSKKKLNTVQIQKDEILAIFKYLQAKLQQFRDYRILLRRRLRKFLPDFQCFLQFYDAAKKCLLKLTDLSELNSFTNVVAKIDIDAFKI